MTTINTNTTSTTAFIVTPDTTGTFVVKTGSGTGTTALTLDTSQNATFAGTVTTVTGAVYPLVSGTAVTVSGTNIDFTGIPSTAKRITIMFRSVSTNNTNELKVIIGDSGGFETTGYSSMVAQLKAAVSQSNLADTAAFAITTGNTAGGSYHGTIVLTLLDSATFAWTMIGNLYSGTSMDTVLVSAGSKALSDTLTQVRINAGGNTFDAGTINIMWE